MDNRKRGSRWVLITGVLITALGLIHVAVTPSIFQTLSSQLDVYSTWVQVYMFAATGAAVIFGAAHRVCIPRAENLRRLGAVARIVVGFVLTAARGRGSSSYTGQSFCPDDVVGVDRGDHSALAVPAGVPAGRAASLITVRHAAREKPLNVLP